ncbi:MAG: YihY/virulence factor BrkB family protein [Dehalococcoidia bacterium]
MSPFTYAKNVAWAVIKKYSDDGCPQLAASISYYVLFSLFPLLIFVVAVAGLFLDTEAQREVVDRVMDVIPLSQEDGREEVEKAVDSVAGGGGQALGIIGLLGMVWGASGMFGAIRRALNTVYSEPTYSRPWVQQKLVDLSLVLGVGVFLATSVFATGALQVVEERSDDLAWLGDLSDDMGWAWTLAGLAIGYVLSFIAFVVLYTVVPSRNRNFRSAVPGALLAALLFEIAKNLFGFYVANFKNFDVIFGSLGAVVAFLFWVFVSAQIMLLGAEFSRALQMVERSTSKQPRLDGMGVPFRVKAFRTVKRLFVREA